ncbi:hypothetical protein RB614_27875, partial [Phytohabitans sp. ZYX-F-186]
PLGGAGGPAPGPAFAPSLGGAGGPAPGPAAAAPPGGAGGPAPGPAFAPSLGVGDPKEGRRPATADLDGSDA